MIPLKTNALTDDKQAMWPQVPLPAYAAGSVSYNQRQVHGLILLCGLKPGLDRPKET